METLGEIIRDARKRKKLTLVELGKLTNLTHGYLSNLENNVRSNPSPDVLRNISNALDVNLMTLMRKAGHVPEETRMEELREEERFLLLELKKDEIKLQELRFKLNALDRDDEEYKYTEFLLSRLESDKDDAVAYLHKIKRDMIKTNKDAYENMSPEEFEKYLLKYEKKNLLDNFIKEKYPDLKDILNQESLLFFDGCELNSEDKKAAIKFLTVLFENKEKNYPSDDQILKAYFEEVKKDKEH
ncbi:helix-turn-helix domain-containing protein [Sporosarcina obsidiansis]|uniref:helix-turn-helix domain-containing protein n=1 Tax=Sporosarcina obsidiansis TaxID=2660748 RepID=UPI001891F1F9|nr:helix-turn-helix transcriptional regulator [Sporosarcina obsidiansis]